MAQTMAIELCKYNVMLLMTCTKLCPFMAVFSGNDWIVKAIIPLSQESKHVQLTLGRYGQLCTVV